MLKLFGISGSLRQGSLNTALLRSRTRGRYGLTPPAYWQQRSGRPSIRRT